jgi:hypothetical protein
MTVRRHPPYVRPVTLLGSHTVGWEAIPVLGLKVLARLLARHPATRSPAVAPSADLVAIQRRLTDVIPLARAEKAMADGCPTPEQELMLMAAGSLAHRARRHPCLNHRRSPPTRS